MGKFILKALTIALRAAGHLVFHPTTLKFMWSVCTSILFFAAFKVVVMKRLMLINPTLNADPDDWEFVGYIFDYWDRIIPFVDWLAEFVVQHADWVNMTPNDITRAYGEASKLGTTPKHEVKDPTALKEVFTSVPSTVAVQPVKEATSADIQEAVRDVEQRIKAAPASSVGALATKDAYPASTADWRGTRAPILRVYDDE